MKEGDILMEQSHKGRQAFSYAFPIMIPMGISFFFIGLGFGLYATSQGFPWWTPPVLAATIFAGSMEFVTIGMLMAGFDPINAFVLTMFVNGRHFSTVYLRYNDMFIWVGSGFLPLLGCVMKALLSTCLQDYRMMWIKNGFTSTCLGLTMCSGYLVPL